MAGDGGNRAHRQGDVESSEKDGIYSYDFGNVYFFVCFPRGLAVVEGRMHALPALLRGSQPAPVADMGIV